MSNPAAVEARQLLKDKSVFVDKTLANSGKIAALARMCGARVDNVLDCCCDFAFTESAATADYAASEGVQAVRPAWLLLSLRCSELLAMDTFVPGKGPLSGTYVQLHASLSTEDSGELWVLATCLGASVSTTRAQQPQMFELWSDHKEYADVILSLEASARDKQKAGAPLVHPKWLVDCMQRQSKLQVDSYLAPECPAASPGDETPPTVSSKQGGDVHRLPGRASASARRKLSQEGDNEDTGQGMADVSSCKAEGNSKSTSFPSAERSEQLPDEGNRKPVNGIGTNDASEQLLQHRATTEPTRTKAQNGVDTSLPSEQAASSHHSDSVEWLSRKTTARTGSSRQTAILIDGHAQEEAVPASKQPPPTVRDRLAQQNQPRLKESPVKAPASSAQSSKLVEPEGVSHDDKPLAGMKFAFGCTRETHWQSRYYEDLSNPTSWTKLIHSMGGRVHDTISPSTTHFVAVIANGPLYKQALGSGLACVSPIWLAECLMQGAAISLSSPLHRPGPSSLLTLKPLSVSITGYADADRRRIKDALYMLGSRYTGTFTVKHDLLVSNSPSSEKTEWARTWGVPCVNASYVFDAIKFGRWPAYEIKYAGIGQVVSPASRIMQEQARRLNIATQSHSAKRILDEELADAGESPKRRKRKDSNGDDGASEAEKRSASNAAPSSTSGVASNQSASSSRASREAGGTEPSATATSIASSRRRQGPIVRFAFTCVEPTLRPIIKEQLEALGGRHATSKECTHLICDKLSKTENFLIGMSVCKHIVTSEWAHACHDARSFVPETPFTPVDADFERRHDFSVVVSLGRAAAMRPRKVFTDMAFYITQGVLPDAKTLGRIVVAGGGRVVDGEPDLRLLTSEETPTNEVFFLISCADDRNAVAPLVEANVPIYNAELILTSALQQRLTLKDFRMRP